MTRFIGLTMLLTPLFHPFDFEAGLLAKLNSLRCVEPVNSLDDFYHLANGHLAGTVIKHHNAVIKAGRHSLLLFFGLSYHHRNEVFPVVGIVFVPKPGNLVRQVFKERSHLAVLIKLASHLFDVENQWSLLVNR